MENSAVGLPGNMDWLEVARQLHARAMVLHSDIGEMMIFTTNNRPVKGARGHHRVNVKHGVSEIHSGARHTLGIIFHDAKS